MFTSLSSWLYGGDPIVPLAFEAPLQAIQARLKKGETYFENLLKQYIINNQHRTTVLLTPDPELGAQRKAAEEQRLAQAKAAMVFSGA